MRLMAERKDVEAWADALLDQHRTVPAREGDGPSVQDLPPGMRMFSCEGCGLMIDRDLNAARNLARLAGAEAGHVAASSAETRNACGEGSAGWAATGPVELPSVKQERTRVHTLTDA